MRRLAKDFGQPHDRHDAAFDNLPQHHPRPDRRQLVHITHQEQARARRQRPQQVQEGKYATKYSNLFDLNTGDIYLYRFPDQPNPVRLNLAKELKKGRLFYDISKLKKQLDQN